MLADYDGKDAIILCIAKCMYKLIIYLMTKRNGWNYMNIY